MSGFIGREGALILGVVCVWGEGGQKGQKGLRVGGCSMCWGAKTGARVWDASGDELKHVATRRAGESEI